MARWIRGSILAACTLILSTTVAVQPVLGDMLTGSYMLPPAGDSKVLPFSGGQFDPNAITMGICFPKDLIVDVSGYFIANPFVMITLDGNTPEFRITCMGTDVVFNLVAPPPPVASAMTPDAAPAPAPVAAAPAPVAVAPSRGFAPPPWATPPAPAAAYGPAAPWAGPPPGGMASRHDMLETGGMGKEKRTHRCILTPTARR